MHVNRVTKKHMKRSHSKTVYVSRERELETQNPRSEFKGILSAIFRRVGDEILILEKRGHRRRKETSVSLRRDRRTGVPRGIPHGPLSLEARRTGPRIHEFITGPKCKLASTHGYGSGRGVGWVCSSSGRLEARVATWPSHREQSEPDGPVDVQKVTIRFCGRARKKDGIGGRTCTRSRSGYCSEGKRNL
jgi:hypothetical protein